MTFLMLTNNRAHQTVEPGLMENETVAAEPLGQRLQTVPDWFKAIHERLDEWRLALLEPHKLVPPGGYHTPKCVAAGLDCILRINEHKTAIERIPTEITAQAIVYRIINHRVPVYYVAEDFIRAVAATELPHDFTLADLHWPMPAMVIGFPLRFMRDYLGTETCYFPTDEDLDNCTFRPACSTVYGIIVRTIGRAKLPKRASTSRTRNRLTALPPTSAADCCPSMPGK